MGCRSEIFGNSKRNRFDILLPDNFRKMKMIKYKLFFLVITLMAFFGAARAQPASVGITPASIDAKVQRGISYTQNFTISNNTGTPLRFRCSVNDMWYDEQNNRLTGRAGTFPRSASLWVQFTPSEIVVEPNSSAVIKAVITVPQGATGSFYTVPVFEGMPVENSRKVVMTNVSTTSIGIKFRGMMMFTTSDGSEYNIEIMNGKVSPPTVSSELELNLDLRNRGSAHARVRGAFAILNASGALAGRGSIEEKRYLPSQRNFIKGKWSGELPPGKYTCLVTLSYNRIGLDPTSMVYEIPFEVK
jgi:hypothetical protein